MAGFVTEAQRRVFCRQPPHQLAHGIGPVGMVPQNRTSPRNPPSAIATAKLSPLLSNAT